MILAAYLNSAAPNYKSPLIPDLHGAVTWHLPLPFSWASSPIEFYFFDWTPFLASVAGCVTRPD